MTSITFLRRQSVESRTGKKRATLYKAIQEGLFPPGVNIGQRAVAWPEHEVDAVNAAHLAGKSDDDIRELVTELVQSRQQAT